MMPRESVRAIVSATTLTERGGEPMDFDDLGWGFWAKMAGIFFIGAVLLFIFTLLFLHAFYAWGLFGTFLFISILALIAGWFFDRRNAGI
jgi:hypothetical protein